MTKIVSELVNGQLLAPSRIPRTVKIIEEEEPPAGSVGVVGGVEGGVPGGQPNGVLGSLLSSTHSAAPPAVATPKRIAISTGISEGLLLHRVEPEYPLIAKRARVEGIVRLKAIISREGVIENLQVIDGHPLLVPSAMEAARQWRYRPYLLNGNAVEVETFISVHFLLG
jgi:protein TonB